MIYYETNTSQYISEHRLIALWNEYKDDEFLEIYTDFSDFLVHQIMFSELIPVKAIKAIKKGE